MDLVEPSVSMYKAVHGGAREGDVGTFIKLLPLVCTNDLQKFDDDK